jgi:hypothetical protein
VVSAVEKLPVLTCPQIAGFQLSTEAADRPTLHRQQLWCANASDESTTEINEMDRKTITLGADAGRP